MAHRHGWFHRFRTWLGFHLLPQCVRSDVSFSVAQARLQQELGALVVSKITEDIAAEDQARKALADMGFPLVVLPDFEEDE